MKRGVIVAVDERFLTLLTNEGEFYYSYKYEAIYEIGQEIEFEPVMKKDKVRHVEKPKFAKVLMLAAVFVLSFLGLSLWPNHTEQTIYAYMTIDINPSIELAVNEQFEVVQLEGYNEDGKKVVAELPSWKNKQFDKIFSDILSIIKRQGYMQDEKEMTFATVIMSNQFNKESIKKHTDFVTKEVNDENMRLNLLEGSKSERQLAQDRGLTLGAYKYLNEKSEKKDTAKSSVDELEESEKDEKVEEEENEKKISINENEQKEKQKSSSEIDPINENKEDNDSETTHKVREEHKEKKDDHKYLDDEHRHPSSVTEKDSEELKLKEKPHHKVGDKGYNEKERNERDFDDDKWHHKDHPGNHDEDEEDEDDDDDDDANEEHERRKDRDKGDRESP